MKNPFRRIALDYIRLYIFFFLLSSTVIFLQDMYLKVVYQMKFTGLLWTCGSPPKNDPFELQNRKKFAFYFVDLVSM